MNRNSLFLLDGYSIIYRSYFAMIRNPLRNSRGENTSAVFGFMRTILQLFQRYRPGYFAVTLDSVGPTFRHTQYPPYKQNRDKTPDELTRQIPIIESLMDALAIPQVRAEGYEADDVMASYAELARQRGMDCYVISGDKDLLQLVGGSVRILKPEKGDLHLMDASAVEETWGVQADQILDYLSLVGDSADNVPGVKGIGPKSATNLLQSFGSLDALYADLAAVSSASWQKKLTEGRESAFLSRDLIRLVRDVPLPLSIEDLQIGEMPIDAGADILREEGIVSLIAELPALSAEGGAAAPPSAASSQSGRQDASRLSEASTPAPFGEPEYTLVDSLEELRNWFDQMRQAGRCAFDSETSSLDTSEAELVGFSLCSQAGKACYCALRGPEGDVPAKAEMLAELKAFLEDESVELVLQNAKYDYLVMAHAGIQMKNIVFDTMIAAWILDSGAGGYGMDLLSRRFLQHECISYKELVPKGQTFDQISLDQACTYAAEDADVCWRLYEFFAPQLTERKLDSVFYDLEMPLIPVLAAMEMEGIGINIDYLERYGQELEVQLERLTGELYELAGYEFNINSTKQLQTLLFEERGLQGRKKTKTGYSTDVSVLQELAAEDPVPQRILQYRRLAKLKSTYVDSLPRMVNPKTGRIHTSFQQTGTATGRLSSKDPNLQNIPIRDDEGRRIREAFVPKSGNCFVSADYSQIELVVLAHLSDDPGLRRAFLQEEDVHRTTGGLVFGLEPEQVSDEQRRIAKTINFGVMYGMSAFRLSRELGIPRRDAEGFIEAYFATYPGIQKFISQTVREAETKGAIRTLFGRERPLPAIQSKNRIEKSSAERIAVNTPIQGTAADIVKRAMLRVSGRLAEEKLAARMLLQVHDELIIECPVGEAAQVKQLLEEEMTGAAELSVPLRVHVEDGKSWGEMH